jgi:hypothetical protein
MVVHGRAFFFMTSGKATSLYSIKEKIMLDIIFNILMFIIITTAVVLIVIAFAGIIADTMRYHTKANAFLALFGLFGGMVAIFAPAIFSQAIPVNNWGTVIIAFSWLIAAPALLLLSVWAYERK